MDIADHKLAVADDLLSLGEVGHIAFIVDSSCEVTSSLLFVGSPGDDSIADAFSTGNIGRELLHVPLNYWFTPTRDS